MNVADGSPRLHPRLTNNFNFLRLFFAALVIFSHSFELIDGQARWEPMNLIFDSGISSGGVAVSGFFLLSGYLIVQSWDTGPRPMAFLSKRALRIYPGFVVASWICLFLVGPLGADPFNYFAQLDFVGNMGNWALLQGPVTPPVFTGHPFAHVNGSMWTICYEFACYLAVLLLGICGLVRYRLGWLVATLGLMLNLMVVALSVRWNMQPGTGGYPPALYDPGFRLGFFFFCGGLFYLYRDEILFRPWLAWLAGGLLLLGLSRWSTANLALAVCGGYLLFYFAFSPVAWLQRFRTLPDVSYGLYLYGFPIQKLIIWYFPTVTPWAVFLVAMVGGVLAGLASWYGIEKPFLRLKPQSMPSARLVAPPASSVRGIPK